PHIFVLVEDGGDDFLNLILQDTGPGMLPEVLKQMREPFFTTKAQGTGLGIPVSVQLIEGMGGRFDVESELEFGTTVTLSLPRAHKEGEFDSIDSQLDEHLRKVLAQSSPGFGDSQQDG
ncbi:MAG: ATP-binding protein, partial [Candidatus Sumerlaeota bacterium]